MDRRVIDDYDGEMTPFKVTIWGKLAGLGLAATSLLGAGTFLYNVLTAPDEGCIRDYPKSINYGLLKEYDESLGNDVAEDQRIYISPHNFDKFGAQIIIGDPNTQVCVTEGDFKTLEDWKALTEEH